MDVARVATTGDETGWSLNTDRQAAGAERADCLLPTHRAELLSSAAAWRSAGPVARPA